MEITYLNEDLWAGRIGVFLVILSFVAALLSTISYFKGSELSREKNSWRSLGRLFFRIHSVSLVGIVAIMFYLIADHAFEYYYVWRHSSSDLPMRYILSCFWEGQEGGFLLWGFFHVVLGNVLMHTAKKWEGATMTIVASVQAFIAAMLLGIFPLGIQIGSDPFILLREHPDMINLPFVQNPEYLSRVEGNGLNPLLQNYWMTIHPPTVFLGFAFTLIPFAYAIAGLWKSKYQEWIKPALSWTYLSVMVLGVGILMGGAWAYEALSFGGFWAWDPVENSSLVPWLVIVGAAHLMLINQRKNRSLFTTFALTLFGFLLVVYSTYLTKSGILGETSVHSFADGLPGQLIIFMLFYLFLALGLLLSRGRSLIQVKDEEPLLSREFWMFIGSLVLVISAFQITISTSIPVINALFGTELAPPSDAIAHYNSWQLPLAVLIVLIIGISQFMTYGKNKPKQYFKKVMPAFLGAIAVSFLMATYLEIKNIYMVLLLFASLFTTGVNFDYLMRMLKGKVMKGGSSIAHIGFALVMLGSLLSAGNKDIISKNRSSININFENNGDANEENVMLMKHDTVLMGPYYVTYTGRRVEEKFVYYDIDYFKVNEAGNYQKEFSLAPYVQLNKAMGNVPEPSTKHFLDKDIFTHVTYADLENLDEEIQDSYRDPDTLDLKVGDSLFTSNSLVKVLDVDRNVDKAALSLKEEDIAIGLNIEARTLQGSRYEANPIMVLRENRLFSIESEIEPLGIKFAFKNVNPDSGTFQLLISEKNANSADFIIMQAIVFPYINVLWIGCIIMAIGTLIAVINRIKTTKYE